MNAILKCSRVIGSLFALFLLCGIWVWQAHVFTGELALRFLREAPTHFFQYLLGVLLPYSVLFLLVAFPFSRLTSFRWKAAFALLVIVSLYFLVFGLIFFSVAEAPIIALAFLFLLSQIAAIWLQRKQMEQSIYSA